MPRADGGTGLGLAIARWAVELHGGDISVVDGAHGCHIQVVIPAPEIAASAPPKLPQANGSYPIRPTFLCPPLCVGPQDAESGGTMRAGGLEA
jgi:hypothetical protein